MAYSRLLGKLALGLLLGTALLAPASAADPAMIYFTRHGEKASAPAKDPDLTAQGQARARQIAAMLRSAGITAIFSTATRRTLQTAQPLADARQLTVQQYDPAQPAALVERVRAVRGAALVVGHSNTVPDLVKAFGGAGGKEIDDLEFDRLYQLIIAPDGSVTTVLLHSTAP